ncbi:hypothetical protein [Pyxidicoccus trucidator]|uniref:hypothetical protein n=1 Tax=Pyxidicoccus trucidator TaxID=2709662 RepID=UPI0013D91B89|nr:hypothetical protein [Pyxidicoccus trucidator]
MGNERRAGPIEALRNLVLALERLVAKEAVSGAVSGAADGLRHEIPEVDGQLASLVQDALTLMGRLVHEAAEGERGVSGELAHTLAASAMQGALEVLEQEWQNGGLPFHGLMVRLNLLFNEAVEFAHSRTDEIRAPGDRAAAMARGVVRAATEELHTAVPKLAEDARCFAPLGAEVAAKVGRGLVEGIESKLREDSASLTGLLERVGRVLVRGLATGIREELTRSPAASTEALGASLEKLAERTAAATVRGAGGALETQGRRWSKGLRRERLVREVGRELTGGVLEAVEAMLRRPVMAVVGAGSALVVVSLLAVRWRTA